jgi:hypothetical protein
MKIFSRRVAGLVALTAAGIAGSVGIAHAGDYDNGSDDSHHHHHHDGDDWDHHHHHGDHDEDSWHHWDDNGNDDLLGGLLGGLLHL